MAVAEKPLLSVLSGRKAEKTPIWLMRQAGRYLPEYRALRAARGGFLDLVQDSEAAAEVTLQPIRRFGFDGAILFSDILVIPHALGQDHAFRAGRHRARPPREPGVGRRPRLGEGLHAVHDVDTGMAVFGDDGRREVARNARWEELLEEAAKDRGGRT